MKIEGFKFYVVVLKGKEVHLEKTKKEAIDTLRTLVENVKPEDIQIAEVDVSEEKWQMSGLNWQEIALELLGGN